MDRHEEPHNALTIYYMEAIMMDRHEWTHTTLTMAFHKGLYLSIIMDRYEGPAPHCPYYSLA
jgi:hypothetical protein